MVGLVKQMKANLYKAVDHDIEDIYLYEDDVNLDESIFDISLTSFVWTLQ